MTYGQKPIVRKPLFWLTVSEFDNLFKELYENDGVGPVAKVPPLETRPPPLNYGFMDHLPDRLHSLSLGVHREWLSRYRMPKGTFSQTNPFDGDYEAPSGFPSGGASFLWINRIFRPIFLILPAFFIRRTSV